MTAAMSEHMQMDDFRTPADGWTVEDLERFPEDKIRRELFDGVLLVSPSAARIHQKVSLHLAAILEASCPSEYDVVQDVDVRFGERRSFAPDIIVITAAAAERSERPFMSHEVILAVEIVSPTSVGMDTITKPAVYAQAGIPLYWRIETAGEIIVYAYELAPVGNVYQAVGRFTDSIEVSEPWPMEIPISRITPRIPKRG